jgi:hypothetical protein
MKLRWVINRTLSGLQDRARSQVLNYIHKNPYALCAHFSCFSKMILEIPEFDCVIFLKSRAFFPVV